MISGLEDQGAPDWEGSLVKILSLPLKIVIIIIIIPLKCSSTIYYCVKNTLNPGARGEI